MRIAYLPDGQTANALYRSHAPMDALGRCGHEVRRLELQQIDTWTATLRWCDVLQIHRACDGGVVELARAAKAAGCAVVWDDDDDVTRVPREIEDAGVAKGLKGARRLVARAKLFAELDLVTTTNAVLADVFRAGGAPRVEVIENYVPDGLVRRRRSTAPVRIGWVASGEHRLDLKHLPIRAVLQQLLDEHADLHVTAIGVDLALRSDRYLHHPHVPTGSLLEHVATFDVGIAPISPAVAMNHTRSNVKLKEYAAVGVPWLASPIGPYAGLGEREGGRLVPDDRWHDELDALIRGDRARRKLAKRAAKWGRSQLLSNHVGRWERVLEPLAATR